MVDTMKTVRSNVLIISALGFDMLFLADTIMHWIGGKFDFSFMLLGSLIAALFPILAFVLRIQYGEDCFIYHTWRQKTKIDFAAVTSVTTETYFTMRLGGYCVSTYGNREFFLYFPLEHKKLRLFFEAIEKANPGAQIDVWWYKRPCAETLKPIVRWGLFILVSLAIILWADSMGMNMSRFFLRKF